ncbi:MAG: leucine-rich repeat domain-containing protein [Verrucomicrobiales bacterium]|nr:leucine-rich repeat domain-containing protein [Verrucomicrobiota bacterium JB025]
MIRLISTFWCRTLAILTFTLGCIGSVRADFTWQLINSDAEVEITGHTDPTGDLSIPAEIDGKPVTSIGTKAFYNCKTLDSIVVPDSVTSFGSSAFYYCESLVSFTVPDAVTSIGTKAFQNCKSLTSISLPGGVTSIESYLFSGCDSLASITIPQGVTSVGNYAFYSCDALSSVVISASVTSIGDTAFSRCPLLTTIVVDPANPAYSSVNGVLFDNDQSELITAPGGLSGSYSIPDGVTAIGDYAFYYCESVSAVILPDSVTTIGQYAFGYCDGLLAITIPDGVTTLAQRAFYRCDGLASVILSGNLTSIEDFTFHECMALVSITIPDSVTAIGESAFSTCESLVSVTLGRGVTTIEDDAFVDCESLTAAIFLSHAPVLGDDVFGGADSGFSITFHEGATGFSTPTWEGYPCEMIPSSATTFSAWAETAFAGAGTSADQMLASADPDQDGRINLFEYAFGGDPTLSDSSAPVTTDADNGLPILSFTIVGDATDLSYIVQTSSDGKTWQDGAVFTPQASVSAPIRSVDQQTLHVSTVAQGDGTHLVRERFTGASPVQFARVRIEQAD